MSDRLIRAFLVERGITEPALLRLLNGYASTVATSKERALDEVSRGGGDILVFSCLHGAEDPCALVAPFKDMPYLLIQWGDQGPLQVMGRLGNGERIEETGSSLTQAISDLVERVGAEGMPSCCEESIKRCAAVVTVNDAKRLEGISPAAERMFQYRLTEVMGQGAELLLPICLPAPERGPQRFETVGTRKDGTRFPMEVRIDEMPCVGGRGLSYVVTLKDLTSAPDPQTLIEEHMVRDELTHLYHYNNLYPLLEQALKRSDHFGSQVATLILGIDHVGTIIEMHGRRAADQILAMTAAIILKELRDVDRVVRLSGDEMIIVLQDTTETKTLATAERIRRAVNRLPLTIRGKSNQSTPVRVTVSIGGAFYPFDAQDSRGMLAAASLALSEAKKKGNDHIVTITSL